MRDETVRFRAGRGRIARGRGRLLCLRIGSGRPRRRPNLRNQIIPPGYRDWRLISVTHLAGGSGKQVRAQLGNDIAIKAFREGQLPFPDGTIIAALHWNEVSSGENDKVLAGGFPGAGLRCASGTTWDDDWRSLR